LSTDNNCPLRLVPLLTGNDIDRYYYYYLRPTKEEVHVFARVRLSVCLHGSRIRVYAKIEYVKRTYASFEKIEYACDTFRTLTRTDLDLSKRIRVEHVKCCKVAKITAWFSATIVTILKILYLLCYCFN